MSTTYEGTPPIADQIAAVPLVILGEIEDVVETTLDHDIDPPRPQTVVSVAVREVLYGSTQRSHLRVRFAGKEIAGKKQAIVFLLAPDYGPGRQDDQSFVPYFNSVFVVGEKGTVPFRPGEQPLPLPEVRQWIARIHQERAERRKELHRFEPEELLRQPAAEVREMPGAGRGPSRSSQPEGKPPDPAALSR
jgi:hypothetical protein